MFNKIFAALLLLIVSQAGNANTIAFSNYTNGFAEATPGDSFIVGSPGESVGYHDEWAMSFTSDKSGRLSDIWLSLSLGSVEDDFSVWISSNDYGIPDYPLLEIDFSITDNSETHGSNDIVHISSQADFELVEGESYWLVVRSNAPGIMGYWDFPAYDTPESLIAERNLVQSTNWDIQPKNEFLNPALFRVDVAAVPLPLPIFLFISGVVTLISVARLSKSQTDTPLQ